MPTNVIVKKRKRIEERETEEVNKLKHKIKTHCPDDLLDSILVNLPVESLTRFKCVSKQWLSLISSRRFIRQHIHYNQNIPSMHSFIINSRVYNFNVLSAYHLETRRKFRGPECPMASVIMVNHDAIKRVEEERYQLDYDSIKGLGEHYIEKNRVVSEKLLLSFLPSNYDPFMITCCCDGIICLAVCDRLFLWNPKTNEYKKLPKHDYDYSIQLRQRAWDGFGFGYDSSIDDYKVVRIPTYLYEVKEAKNPSVYVMNLKSNLWRKIYTDFPYIASQYGQAISVDGNLYWFAHVPRMDNEIVLIAFDLGKEMFREVRLPPNALDTVDPNSYPRTAEDMRLGVLEGCISLASYNEGNHCFDIWIMRGDCNWIKITSFPLNIYKVPGTIRTLRPLFFNQNGGLVMHAKSSIIFRHRGELSSSYYCRDMGLIYDPKQGTCKTFHVATDPWFEVFLWTPSLVSLSM